MNDVEQTSHPTPSARDHAAPPLQVLWVGDATVALRLVSRRAPYVQIVEVPATVVGHRLKAEPPPDLLVLDATLSSVDSMTILDLIESGGVDIPVVLLTPPGNDLLPMRATRLPTCDIVVKTPDFVHQLLPAFTQARARHDLLTALHDSREHEERLRRVLELQPAATCVISANTALSAINQAGSTLLGAPRDQLLGTAFTNLVPLDEQGDVAAFIGGICAGGSGEFLHSIVRRDGTSVRVRMRAVAMTRADGIVALATMHEEPEVASVVAAPSGPELESLRIALERARSEADGLRADRDVAISERQTAEAQQQEANRHVMTALRDAELERERLAHELQALKAALETLTEQRRLLEATASAAHANEVQQAQTIADLEAERERLRSDLQAAQAAPVIDPAEREQMTAALDMAHARSQALADTIDRLEATLIEATGRQQQDGEALARIESENRSLREELMRAGEESRALGADVQAGRDELLALRTSHDTQRSAFESQQIAIDALQSERDELEGRLRDAVAQCATISAEREEWARARQDARLAHAAAILEIEAERDRLAQAVLAADERSAALAQAGREAAAAASSAADDDLRRELQAADSRCQHLVERLAEAQAAADQSEAGRAALAESLAIADQRLVELTAIGRSLQAGHDDLNGLRQALTRFLVDADIRCKAIATRQTDLLTRLGLSSDQS